MIDNNAAGAGKGNRTPKGRSPADFEFHSQFCTVMKVCHSTIFLNGLLEPQVAPGCADLTHYDPT